MLAANTSSLTADLPDGYYRDNFEVVLDRVRSHYSDLLTPHEAEVLTIWPQLPKAAQRLLVRLLTRKGPLFRLGKLRYREIESVLTAAEHLAEAKLISINPLLTVHQYVALYSKPECLARLAQLPLNIQQLRHLRNLPRPAFDTALTEMLGNLPAAAFCNEPILALTDSDWFDTFKLLFFGRPGQDLTEFVVRDLGHVRFETYQIDKSLRMFSSRAEIDSQLALYRYSATLETALKADAPTLLRWLQQLPAFAPGDARGSRRWQRVVLAGARQLERLEEFEAALEYYQLCELPPARERRARILARSPTGGPQALALLRGIAANPIDEAERQTAHSFGTRLARQLQQPWPAAPHYKPLVEQLTLARTNQPVEIATATELSEHGPCFYVENSLFNTIFALLYWPVIFAPVPGAFSHPFQAAPLDLYEPEFCTARSQWLETIEQQLAHPLEWAPLLRARSQEKHGIACPFIAWERFESLPIEQALHTIPSAHWRAIFRRFLTDLREHRAGLPDLILFPATGGYCLIEVKAPGDRIQPNQLRWMRYFAEHRIPHRVVQVEWRP